MTLRKLFRIACLLAALNALPAYAETMARATQLMPWGVFDASGKEIARCEDLLIDTEKNRLVALLLSVGQGEYRQVALPVPIAGAKPQPQGGLVLEGWTREKVVALPNTDKEAIAANPALRYAVDILRGDIHKDGKKIADIVDLVVRLDAPGPVTVAAQFDPAFYKSEALVGISVTSIEPAGANFNARFDRELKLPPPPKPVVAAPPPPPPIDPDARLTQILGALVVDAAGAAVGQVKELAVDSSRRVVTHVVVASGSETAAYPLARFSVRFDAGKPVFVLAERKDAVAVDPQGLVANRAPASRLLRSAISDPGGKMVGDVEDVVVNLKTGRLHFAVAEFNPNWVAAGWMVAIPVRPLRQAGEGETLAMQFDLNELNRAYLFQKGQFPDVNDHRFRDLIERHLAASGGK